MNFDKSNYKKLSTEELVIKTQNKDYKALEEIIRREQRNIYAIFIYLCKNGDNVYDLTQEALLRMSKGLSNLKNPKTFKSWLNQIVMHIFYDDLRKKNRNPKTLSIDDDSDPNYMTNPKFLIPDKRCKPMEKCISNELDRLIKKKIRELPETFRVAIVLRELQGLSYDEIAEATNTNIGTVKSRIARARTKLQEDLKSYI